MSSIASFFDPNTPESRRYRGIENSHLLWIIARNSNQIKQVTAAQFAQQAEAAQRNQSGLCTLAWGQNETLNALMGIQAAQYEISEGVQSVGNALTDLRYALEGWLEQVSNQLQEQKEVLSQIAETLTRPLATAARELRQRADIKLRAGAEAGPREREEWFREAVESLELVTANPVGEDDYVAWFSLAWLHWKFHEDLPAAEKAFARAARLSSLSRDGWYLHSLSHLAYMRYLRRDCQGANEAISEALTVSQHHQVLFDASRYAATVGAKARAVDLLRQSIHANPLGIIAMLYETEFADMATEMRSLVRELGDEARAESSLRLRRWSDLLLQIEKCGQEADCHLDIPCSSGASSVGTLEQNLATADYLAALRIGKTMSERSDRAAATACAALQAAIQGRKEAARLAHAAVQQAKQKAAAAIGLATSTKQQAVAAADRQVTKVSPRTTDIDVGWWLVGGGIGGLIGFVLGLRGGWSADFLAPVNGAINGAILGLILVAIPSAMAHRAEKARADGEAAEQKRVAAEQFTIATQHAQEELSRVLSGLEAEARQADDCEARAEKALASLRASAALPESV